MFMEEPPARFAYDCPAWTRSNPVACYLTEQHRQDDDDFLTLLAAIRRNGFANDHLGRIESRKIDPHAAPKNAPKLYSHNADVDRVNDRILAQLSGEPQVFAMSAQGPEPLVAALKKGCISPETLCLKAGAAVMFTKNNPQEGFVNGTLGTVEGFDKHDGYPVIKTRSGRSIEVEPMDWAMEENGAIRARITQLPLRLAWAITVHKSQGMSLDEAVVDLSAVFEFGQGYVALSRVRRLSGLHLLGWNQRAFQVHPEVVAKDAQFRAESEQAAHKFGLMAGDEITAIEERFMRACGGKIVSAVHADAPKVSHVPRTANASGFKKIRETNPSAYLSWNPAEDNKLRELFGKGSSVVDLARIFSRTSGAISARLAKLGLSDN